MILFSYLNDDISRLDARVLIGFTVEDILLSIRCTLVNQDLKDLLFLDNFLSFAGLAFVRVADSLTLAIAIIARLSALGVHARTQLLHDSPHSAALASGASLDCSTLTTCSVTLGADTISADNNL